MNSTNNSLLEDKATVKTQAKLSGDSYQLTQARLKHLMIVSPVVIYSCNPEGNFDLKFVSDNIENQLGYKSRELTDDTNFWVDRIHPEDKAEVFKKLTKISEHGNLTQDYRILHKDGTYRWIQDVMSLISDDEGRPIEIIGSWIDITQQKEAEERLRQLNNELTDKVSIRTSELKKLNHALKQEIKRREKTEKDLKSSENIYQDLIDNADVFMTALSKEGVYFATSETNANRLIEGAKPEDIIGKCLYDFHPRERADKYMEEIREIC